MLLDGEDLTLGVGVVDEEGEDVVVVGELPRGSRKSEPGLLKKALGELLLEVGDGAACLPIVGVLGIYLDNQPVLVKEETKAGSVEDGEVVPVLMVAESIDIAADGVLVVTDGDLRG